MKSMGTLPKQGLCEEGFEVLKPYIELWGQIIVRTAYEAQWNIQHLTPTLTQLSDFNISENNCHIFTTIIYCRFYNNWTNNSKIVKVPWVMRKQIESLAFWEKLCICSTEHWLKNFGQINEKCTFELTTVIHEFGPCSINSLAGPPFLLPLPSHHLPIIKLSWF